ncbi:MAG: glycosyltransferase family 2 protein [Pseudomonadota bacterium]
MKTNTALPIVASLWIGGELSYLEQVCLKSFADHGHRVILYTYGAVTGVPDCVEVFDANLIFPNQSYIRHAKSGSPAVHADAFRYRMIELQNVIWVDADMLCMRPWDFSDQWVFGWEKPGKLVCNAVLGLPRFSKTLKRLNALCATEYPIPPWAPEAEQARLKAAADAGNPVHVSEMAWGVWGPSALTYFLNDTGEMAHVLPQMAFFPISFRDRRMLLAPGDAVDRALDDGCYGVHLWNRRLRRRLVTHEGGIAAPDSFLGRALARHGIDPNAAPIPDEPPAHIAANVAAEAAPQNVGPAPAGRSVAPPTPVSTNPNVAPHRPAALEQMPLMRLRQSAEYQQMIDGLEERTSAIMGWLKPPDAPLSNGRVLAVTSMKNEGPFILEWIAYHLGIGVGHFLIYTNDCTDNTNAMLDHLQDLGIVTRLDNPWDPNSGKKPQHEALKDAVKQPCYGEADWVLTIDVDEFLNIHVGDGTLPDLFTACNEPNVISFTWKFFGNRDVPRFEDRLITEQFTACAPEFIPKPRLGWGFKSMFHKSAPYGRIGVHRPLDLHEGCEDQVRWVNGSGRVMPDQLLTNNGWRSTKRSLGYRLATLNHYILRSAESFLVKRERGRINHTEHDQGIEYWTRRNYATETDTRILARHDLMQPWLTRFRDDAVLARLHGEAVAWHRKRIAALKRKPDYRALYKALVAPDQPDALFVAKPDAEAEEAPDTAARVPSPLAPLAKPIAVQPPDSALQTPRDPRWSEARDAAQKAGGFFWEGPNNAFMFVPRSRRLIVSFDNISSARETGPRWPWGYKVLHREMGASVLGVMAAERNWFRDDFVPDAFQRLDAAGFFGQFDQVLFYGASMGGFGALTFCRHAPGAHVLALAPQSTLNADILPGESRWRWTRKLDWSGPYADAAGTLAKAGQVSIIADPYYAPDHAQVSRLMAPNVQWLHTPFMGHQIPNAFVMMGILKDMLFAAADGALSPAFYYAKFRARRDLPRYQHDLLMEAERRGKIRAAIQICEYTLKKRKAGNIEASLHRLRAELAEAQATEPAE